MSRYARMFERLHAEHAVALGAFVMLGDPDLETSRRRLDDLVASGADMLELGIPFSDPIADGPIIQAAAGRALAAGVRLADCFELIADVRTRHPRLPIGILTYANIVLARGRPDFCRTASAAGADSLLVADVPSIEAAPWLEHMNRTGIEPVLIAASNTPPATLARIAQSGGAYTYCVTRAGVTGTEDQPQFDRALVARLAEVDAPPPVFGFGISSPGQVAAARAAGAAGVICGSAIVRLAAEGGDVGCFVASLRSAARNELAAH